MITPGKGGFLKNWAGNQRWRPASFEAPASEAHIAEVIGKAAAAGQRVKPIASGHSFTAIATTNGVQLSLENHNTVRNVDTDTGLVTVDAGISLANLNDELARHGLALTNMGDIAYQSIAGAISTSTHGTGAAFGNIASQVHALRMVTASGDVLAIAADDPELFGAARVGLGALGVVSEVTLQCVPAFNLTAMESNHKLVDMLDGEFDDIAASVDHPEYYWMPRTRSAFVKRNTRTDAPADVTRFSHVRDRIIGENLAFGLVNRVGRRMPAAVPKIAKLVSSASSERSFTDRSDKVFTSPRWVKFYEMEYAIPREHLSEAVRRIDQLTREISEPITFPIEVRVSAGDDSFLSTAYGRDTGYVACHVFEGTSYDNYFQGVESIMNDYAGRPHWGKLHFQTASTLSQRYPMWDRFIAVRDRLDPDGVFRNPYLDRVLGPPPGN